MLKKIMTFIIALTMLCLMSIQIASANSMAAQQGAYYQLGQYNGDPIIWKCISTDDENGSLLLSDKILCFKAFDARSNDESSNHYDSGNGFWQESTIRAWLNAITPGSEIIWPGNNPPNTKYPIGPYFPYADENGFLSDANFTETERSAMKTVSQWQILSKWNSDLSTNGVTRAFQTNYAIWAGEYDHAFVQGDISKVNHIEGAMNRLSDTMFLLDIAQVRSLWQNFGTLSAFPTDKAFEQIKDDVASVQRSIYNDTEYIGGEYMYSLRTPAGYHICYAYGDTNIDAHMPAYVYGIRPAFYLNEERTVILSGSGTESDPYVIDGIPQYSVSVFSQGDELQFDQAPIEENDRLLVPMRSVFESLDADVYWNDQAQVATAVKDDTTIWVQVDNPVLSKGTGETVELDVPARLVGDRTMVPLRAVSEALGAKVDYIENLNRVVIDKPKLPMDFGEGQGLENWQQDWFIERFGSSRTYE